MNKLFFPIIVLVCTLITSCDQNEVLPGGPMVWTYEIETPANVVYEGASVDWTPKYCFKANGEEGDLVMTCKNFDKLNPISGDSYTYDCGWAILTAEDNRVKIHFPYHVSDEPDACEEIIVSANDGKRKAKTIICLSRYFKSDGGSSPDPDPVADAAKFKLKLHHFTPFMDLDAYFPAPFDLLTFRITDMDDNYSQFASPDFTQYYDSIVWSADGMPDTYKVYAKEENENFSEEKFNSQWSSNFFRSGTINTHLKGYKMGKVEYETSLDVTLYNRDFLGIDWCVAVLQKPDNLTKYCLLDKNYEYIVNDVTLEGLNPFSKIIPVNHKQLSHSDYMQMARNAIMTLMETNVGNGRSAKGKEKLFKCLPEKNVEAELYWDNSTSMMIMLHQLPEDPDELLQEKYYLHIEPKSEF